MQPVKIDPDLLLQAYAMGIFPMSEDADDRQVFWVQPEKRGIIPLSSFHAPRSLLKTVRRRQFEIEIDKDFHGVIDGCAESKEGRQRTWINGTIRDACHALFERGHCHTVEAYFGGALVGGLYGVTLGGAFFGESMFSTMTDASKVCLVHLVEKLKERQFQLLDTQFLTPHLARFGTVEISRKKYEKLLADALKINANFFP
jgi:leucyl/phenylalanyl-tRNA---protein transferase